MPLKSGISRMSNCLDAMVNKSRNSLKPFNCSLPILSLSFSLTCHRSGLSFFLSHSYLPRQYTGLHNPTVKQQMPPQQCWDYFFYTGSSWPKSAYVTNPIPPEMRSVTYKLHSQWCSCFRLSVLPVPYMQHTFAPVSNFEVGHFARHFFFLSFGDAMKGIQFTPLHFHISFLSFVRITTCFLSRYGWLLDSHNCWLFHLHIQHTTHIFKRQSPVGSSDTADCGFCFSISLQKDMNQIINPAMDYIMSQLSFYKDGFCIRCNIK